MSMCNSCSRVSLLGSRLGLGHRSHCSRRRLEQPESPPHAQTDRYRCCDGLRSRSLLGFDDELGAGRVDVCGSTARRSCQKLTLFSGASYSGAQGATGSISGELVTLQQPAQRRRPLAMLLILSSVFTELSAESWDTPQRSRLQCPIDGQCSYGHRRACSERKTCLLSALPPSQTQCCRVVSVLCWYSMQ